jgi:hypothetical protein
LKHLAVDPHWDRHTGEARKQFFSEEKNQKTFAPSVDVPDTTGPYRIEQKFFGSFFQKGTAFLPLCLLVAESHFQRGLV